MDVKHVLTLLNISLNKMIKIKIREHFKHDYIYKK